MVTTITATLNDVNMEAVAGLAGKIQEEPAVPATTWNARAEWKGGFRSEAKVREFEPTIHEVGRARCLRRNRYWPKPS